MYAVTIWLNVQRDSAGHAPGFSGHKPEHAMEPSFCYVTEAADDQAVCNQAFHAFNAPEEILSGAELSLAKRYRANRIRSLSVGDIVQVDDRYYAVDHIGWKPAERPATLGKDSYDSFSPAAEAAYKRAQERFEAANNPETI